MPSSAGPLEPSASIPASMTYADIIARELRDDASISPAARRGLSERFAKSEQNFTNTLLRQGTVAVGFYTPNYKPLADQLAANLDEHSIRHKLYPVAAGDWGRVVLMKPAIVRQAMRDFPGQKIVLMDVDCIIKGHLPAAAFDQPGDVSYYTCLKRAKRRTTVYPSDRVVVFQPTAGAMRLVDLWEERCRAADRGETGHNESSETCLLWAITKAVGTSFSQLPVAYSGREFDIAPANALIVHKSQHDHTRPIVSLLKSIKDLRRALISKAVGKSYMDWKYGDGY